MHLSYQATMWVLREEESYSFSSSCKTARWESCQTPGLLGGWYLSFAQKLARRWERELSYGASSFGELSTPGIWGKLGW